MLVAKQIAAEQWVVMLSEKDADKKLPLSQRFESTKESLKHRKW